VTFGRLLLAGLPVAVWFGLAAWGRWALRVRRAPEAAVGLPSPVSAYAIGWLVAEAAGVTLFASLWFDSLGSGGWWLLFGLVGFLVGFPGRLLAIPDLPEVRRLAVRDGLYDVTRYIAAGGILAWGLG
jgi:hypothetical protein